MKPTEERIRFAARLCSLDLDQMNKAKWERVWKLIVQFFEGPAPGGVLTVPIGGLPTKSFTSNERELAKVGKIVQEIQNGSKDIFDALIEGRETKSFELPTSMQRVSGKYSLMSGSDGTAILMVHGRPAEMFLLRLNLLLAGVNTRKIQKCPECGAPFVKIRRQRYCSRFCVNRVNKRAWRTREEKKEQERQKKLKKRRSRYASKKSSARAAT